MRNYRPKIIFSLFLVLLSCSHALPAVLHVGYRIFVPAGPAKTALELMGYTIQAGAFKKGGKRGAFNGKIK